MNTKNDIVKIRTKKLSNGNSSIYLDTCKGGKREYEFLRLYLIPEITRNDKNKNKETLRYAEAIRAKRVVEIQNGEWGFRQAFKEDTNFLDYYRAMCTERYGPETMGNWGNWMSCLKRLEIYCSKIMTFKNIDKEWLLGFKEFLNNEKCRDKRKYISEDDEIRISPLSEASKSSYFNKVRACLNKAFDEGIIASNPARHVPGFKNRNAAKSYLTIEEVKKLAETPCKYPPLKKAFLFSCLTGLRKSDVEKLRWKDVHKQGDYTRIIFRQKKTKSNEYLDISEQAVFYMGERRELEDLVFVGYRYTSAMHVELERWILRAGITKKITFHCARHTFAVLMLDLGADIYTVQKLLGHKDIRTTQLYAKVLDKNKQAAITMIPNIIPDLEI